MKSLHHSLTAPISVLVLLAAGESYAQRSQIPAPGLSLTDVEFRNGLAIWHRDIVVDTESHFRAAVRVSPDGLAVANVGSLWPVVNGVAQVPYTLNAATGSALAAVVQTAITSFNTTFTGVIQFVPAATQTNQVVFQIVDAPIPGCSGDSIIGMVGGMQNLNLSGGADCPMAIIQHEMGHAIGLFHEQGRSDRDNYVTVNYPAIARSRFSEFSKLINGYTIGLYDYGSTMHYGRYIDARDLAVPTMETIPPGIPMQQEGPFSAGDVDVIRRLYGMPPQQVTITSNPAGAQVIVDGNTITTPMSFNWAIGSTHNLDVPAGVQMLDGAPYLFSGADGGGVLGRWSDQPAGSPSAHTITVVPGDGSNPTLPASAPAITVYSAHFIELIPVPNFSANPGGSATIQITPAPVTVQGTRYVIANQPVTLTATPAAGYKFYDWNPSTRLLALGYGANPLTLRPSRGTLDLNPAFTQNSITTVTASRPGLIVTVDGRRYATPKNFARPFDLGWTDGSTHSISAEAQQFIGDPAARPAFTRFKFTGWSDGGTAMHNIPVTLGTVTANYTTQYGVLLQNSPSNAPSGCAGSAAITNPPPDDPYYDAGYTLNLGVTPKAGWNFTGWQGDATGTAMSLTADGEKVFAPSFNLSTDPLVITSISPSTVAAGSGDLQITLNGTGFVNGAIVCAGGTCGNATFVSGNQLTATVPAASLANAGPLGISVQQADPTACTASSNTAALTVTPKAAATSGAAAFVKTDATTSGNWKGVYGADGYNVVGDTASYPTYVTVTPAGNQSFTWAQSTTDARAPQKGSAPADRIASCWYSQTSFTIDLNFSDTNTHQVALYLLDWDGFNGGRNEKIDILDTSGNVLDTRSMSSFGNGQYLVWNLSGHVVARITNNNAPSNALLNALLFGAGGQ